MKNKLLMMFTDDIFKNDNEYLSKIDEQLQISMQILINRGYEILVTGNSEKSTEFAMKFSNIFYDENIKNIEIRQDYSQKINLINDSKYVICFRKNDLMLVEKYNKPFIFIDVCEKNDAENKDILNNSGRITVQGLNAGEIVKKVEEVLKVELKVNKKNKSQSKNELEQYKKQVKKTIEQLINENKLDEAKSIIDEYEEIVKNDVDIYSMKAIIAIIENNIDEAYNFINAGLNIECLNCELMYNLAYLYEINNKYLSAYKVYKKLCKICNGSLLNIVKKKIKEYENNSLIKEYNKRKKVLIIAYIYPPLSGSGVQRTLKFTRYLRGFGWEPIVVTVKNAQFPFKDNDMLSEIPNDIEIIRIAQKDTININELINLYSFVVNNYDLMNNYINALNKSKEDFNKLAILPDSCIIWAKEVIKQISDRINFNNIDLIYTTSGPYSDHLIGYYLKIKYEKPWIVDFRDEWTNNPYINIDKKSLIYKVMRSMEDSIVNLANKVITVTELSTKNYVNNFKLDNKVITITNGYDENDFDDIDILSHNNNDKFTIVHNGMFYMIRTPKTFLYAVKNLINKNLINKKDLNIIFTYTENDQYWKNYTKKLKLNNIVKFAGYLNHKKSLKIASKANLLLLVVGEGEQNKSVYTGKVFEYLRLCKPILSLSPIGSLVDKLIKDTNRGKNIDFNNIAGIEEYLLYVYKKWKNGEDCSLKINNEIKKYDRIELTRQLSNQFNNIINSNNRKNDLFKCDVEEKNNNFYNEVYKNGGWNQTYFKHYSEAIYFEMWENALILIKKHDRPNIIDIGCGPGQFANFILDNGILQYKGIDFSSQAIKIAKIRNDKYRQLFKVDNAFTSSIFNGEYNIVILFEVLEHIEEDLKILSRITKGANVIFSVPDFYSVGHVRWFKSKIDIIERYKKLVRIRNIYSYNVSLINKIYLIDGIKI
ncbi:methyltransferase domain-containing protein [Clostridium sp. JNZ X4-2]